MAEEVKNTTAEEKEVLTFSIFSDSSRITENQSKIFCNKRSRRHLPFIIIIVAEKIVFPVNHAVTLSGGRSKGKNGHTASRCLQSLCRKPQIKITGDIFRRFRQKIASAKKHSGKDAGKNDLVFLHIDLHENCFYDVIIKVL